MVQCANLKMVLKSKGAASKLKAYKAVARDYREFCEKSAQDHPADSELVR